MKFSVKLALIFFCSVLLISILSPILLNFVTSKGNFLILQSPYAQNLSSTLESPSITHLLGTDILGRDIFARLFFSTYHSIINGLLATFTALFLGIFVAGFCAWKGGIWDKALVYSFEFFFSLPLFFILIIIANIFNGSQFLIWISLGIAGWTIPGRYMRGEVLKIKKENFILASKLMGASDWHILKFHLISFGITPILTVSVFNLASMILLESSLSFLGLGINPPATSWGKMIADGMSYMEIAPWTYLPASLILLCTIISLDIISVHFKKILQNKQY